MLPFKDTQKFLIKSVKFPCLWPRRHANLSFLILIHSIFIWSFINCISIIIKIRNVCLSHSWWPPYCFLHVTHRDPYVDAFCVICSEGVWDRAKHRKKSWLASRVFLVFIINFRSFLLKEPASLTWQLNLPFKHDKLQRDHLFNFSIMIILYTVTL